jgi:hypothetical protein
MTSKRSIVLDLQLLSTNKNVDISELLRKSLLIASKLKLDKFKSWINSELHGYNNIDEVPSYRVVNTELKLKNPYHGLIPVVFSNQDVADIICHVQVTGPIEALASLLTSEADYLQVPLSHRQQAFLMKLQGFAALPAVRVVGHNQVAAIIDAVRTTILQWALELESDGILGEGLVFTEEERSKAVSNTNINIERIDNFQGMLGSASESSITQNMNQNSFRGDFNSLRSYLINEGIAEKDITELKSAIDSDGSIEKKGAFGENVSSWIGRMLTKSANGSWQVGIAAAGNLLSEAIGKYYGL